MKASTRVYVVKNVDQPDVAPRLVRATYGHMAERHVIGSMLHAYVATKDDIINLMGAGVKVEHAGDEVGLLTL